MREYIRYLDAIEEKNPKSQVDLSGYRFIMESMTVSSATEFSREQRTSIANKTLECREHLRAFDSMMYLYVLENHCQYLNTSMDILRRPDLVGSKLNLPNGLASSCFLFVLAWEIARNEDHTNIVKKSEVLVRLTQNVSR